MYIPFWPSFRHAMHHYAVFWPSAALTVTFNKKMMAISLDGNSSGVTKHVFT
jgi:hypothetical protein